MVKQSKVDSALEVVTNTTIGAVISLMVVLVWFPLIGKPMTLWEDLMTVVVFTSISLLRSYGVRRLFNGKSVYLTLKERFNGKS